MAAALRSAQALNAGVDIQIEVETLGQLREALDAGADSVLLDNFDRADDARGGGASTPAARCWRCRAASSWTQLRAIAATGVDRISIGSLTKDVRAIDYSMRVEG